MGQKLRNTQADVAGGDPTACSKISNTTPVQSYTTLATTLESVIAANQGRPCVFQAGGNTGPRNEWWTQSTVSIGTLGNAPVGGNQTSTYTTNVPLRAAFGPNNVARFYACQQRATDGSVRNCNSIGTGTYTIAQLGNARVLTFQGEPAQFSALSYQRAFVERGGAVYYGYHNRPVTTSQARLNLKAANALFTQLGMPTVDPESTPALTAASYQGEWILNGSGAPLDTFTGIDIHLSGNGGAATCTDNQSGQGTGCTVTLDPATGAVSYSGSNGSASGTFVFDTGAASGTFTPTGAAPQPFVGQRR